MVALQAHILAASGFRLLVTDEQLLDAHSILDAATGDGLAAIQRLVGCQAQHLQEWQDGAMQQLQQQQAQQRVQPGAEAQALPPAVQVLAGDVAAAPGAQVAEHSAPPAATLTRARDGAGRVHADQQQEEVQQRAALRDITSLNNTAALQPLDDAAKPHGALSAGFASKVEAPPQQQQRHRPTTQQQDKQRPLQQRSSTQHVAQPAASSRQAKTQLLQLASREQAVGSKRRRDVSDSAAAQAAAAGVSAGAQLQAQQQRGMAGGFSAGGRMLLRMMRTATSAVQSLGSRQ